MISEPLIVTKGASPASSNGVLAATACASCAIVCCRLRAVDDAGHDLELDVEAPPRPGQQRVPQRRLALDQALRPFGAVAEQVALAE